jgi:predicted phage tail protein
MAKFVSTIAGAALIGTGLFLEFVTIGASTPLTAFLISAGIGMVMTGIGTMLSKGPLAGTSTASRNPIAPWNVVYGRAKIGGALIYFG